MKSTRTPTVFCHYLPWYTIQQFQYNQVREGWCGHGTDCLNTSQTQYNSAGPLIGEYTQLEDHVLEYHLLLAQAAGIDAFIVNINPLSTLQLEIVKKLYDVATKLFRKHSTSFNLKLLLSYDNSKATTQTLIDADFLVLSKLLTRNQSFIFQFSSLTNQLKKNSLIFKFRTRCIIKSSARI